MKIASVLLGLGVIAIALGVSAANAAPTAAATSVASKLQLRGHLQELGESPSLRVFLTADAYDTYHRGLGDADVFPASSSLFMSFDREILALYARGNDTGGRCLQTGSAAAVSGDTIALDLSWQSGTCGAPATAHYPFILLSLARQADDRSSWIASGRQVCATAPGIDASRACAPVTAGASPSPSPSPSASPSPSPSATATATASTIASPTQTESPSPTRTLTPTPTPAPTATRASPSAVAQASAPPGPDGGTDVLTYGLIAVGLIIGAIVIAIALSTRTRVYKV
ncbi:MAG: hypothetical protein AUH85_05060 [Chloroflexi bacterium 13_1_40CM_4_68_4]|nr:MAG: hypothetical protein AUH85_05060 [Chloroflexi bacterium 13_1_40CM_4_68_4]